MFKATNINRRCLAFWFLRMLIGVILIGLLLARIYIGDILSVISGVAWYLLTVLIGLYFLGVAVSAVKWKVFIPQYPLRQLLRLSMVGQFYSLVLPGQIAGEAVKAYRLGKGKKDAELIATSVVLDKITGLISLLLLGLTGLYFSALHLPLSLAIGLSLILGGTIALLTTLRLSLISKPLLQILRVLAARHEKIRRPMIQLQFVVQAWIAYLNRPVLLIKAICVGLCYQLIHVSIILLLAWRFGVSVAISDWLWIFSVISVAVLLPVTIGGLGVREGAFVGILGKLDVVPETALAISLTIFGLQVLAGMMGFFFEIFTDRERMVAASASNGARN